MYRVWYKVGASLEAYNFYDSVMAWQTLIDIFEKCPLFVSEGAQKVWLEYFPV